VTAPGGSRRSAPPRRRRWATSAARGNVRLHAGSPEATQGPAGRAFPPRMPLGGRSVPLPGAQCGHGAPRRVRHPVARRAVLPCSCLKAAAHGLFKPPSGLFGRRFCPFISRSTPSNLLLPALGENSLAGGGGLCYSEAPQLPGPFPRSLVTAPVARSQFAGAVPSLTVAGVLPWRWRKAWQQGRGKGQDSSCPRGMSRGDGGTSRHLLAAWIARPCAGSLACVLLVSSNRLSFLGCHRVHRGAAGHPLQCQSFTAGPL
jgi:hypothetical protein